MAVAIAVLVTLTLLYKGHGAAGRMKKEAKDKPSSYMVPLAVLVVMIGLGIAHG